MINKVKAKKNKITNEKELVLANSDKTDNKIEKTDNNLESFSEEKSFSEIDLYKYELYQAKVAKSLNLINLKRYECELLKKNAEEQLRLIKDDATNKLKKFNDELKILIEQAKIEEEKLRNLQQYLGGKYKVDLSKISYDDETGKIFE